MQNFPGSIFISTRTYREIFKSAKGTLKTLIYFEKTAQVSLYISSYILKCLSKK